MKLRESWVVWVTRMMENKDHRRGDVRIMALTVPLQLLRRVQRLAGCVRWEPEAEARAAAGAAGGLPQRAGGWVTAPRGPLSCRSARAACEPRGLLPEVGCLSCCPQPREGHGSCFISASSASQSLPARPVGQGPLEAWTRQWACSPLALQKGQRLGTGFSFLTGNSLPVSNTVFVP